MDYRRIGLFGAFAVASLYLVVQWKQTQDIDARALENAQESTMTDTSVNTSFTDNSGQDSQTDINSEDGLVSNPTTSSTSPQVQDEPVITENALIDIHTDLLSVKINSKNGDIVYTALNDYSVSLEHSDTPVTILNNTNNYLFVAQSYLRSSSNDVDASLFSAEKTTYNLEDGQDSLDVRLTYTGQSDLELTKIYTFYKGKYIINVSYEVKNISDADVKVKLDNRLKRDDSPDPAQSTTAASFVGFAFDNQAEESIWDKYKFKDLAKESAKLPTKGAFSLNQTVTGGYVAFSQKYFVVAWIPNQNETQHQKMGLPKGYDYYFAINESEEFELKPGATKTLSAKLWVGPELQEQLDEYHEGLKHSVDYGMFYIFAKPIYWVLTKIQSFVPNWGLAIILLTLLVKFVFFPLSQKSMKSMAKMKKLAPKMTQLRERYGDDRQKMSTELMKFYKKEGINPVSGCLPMLVQMPIWISLYWVLIEAVEIRQMPFTLWIQDLSAADPLFIFPVLMGVSMYFQMKMTQSANMDPMQQKIFKFMPIGMTLFFIIFGMPAGLMLYWTVNNIFTICQQYIVNKQIDREEALAKAEAAAK
ncbi:membrane protein insertase YidC [Marinicellulosiphila megalodicopiae]|uniref:membrane protein insertase YidC n=1 Tax=Marinicellulosiphila megalodicopiae TaxID=2724896 RepID=UPI003BB1D56C